MAPPQQRPLSSLGGWRNRSVESLELARISTQLSTRDSIYPVPPVPVLDPSRVSKYESGADGSVTRKKDKKGDASSRKSHDPQRHSKKKSAAAAASSSAADDKHAGNKEVDDDESAGTVVAPAAGDDDEDPYGHLPEHQAEILKRQVETNQKNYSFWSIFRYATTFDIVIMAVAGITSIASGAAMPAMTIIFGGFQSTFQAYMVTGELTFDEFKNEMAQSVLYFVYLAIGTFFATYISTVGFLYTGEHITTNLRVAYLESCLKQNIGFFDKVGAGEVAVKITSDANRIQDGISEKLGLLLAAISTLISGFVIGFIVSWKLTLILASSFFAMFINTAIWGTLVGRYSIPLMINTAKASSLTQEMMSSIRVAIAFSSQDRLTAQYDRLLKIAQRDGFKVKAAIGMMIGIVMGLSHLSYGLGFWQGSNMLARGELEVNEVVTSIMAVMIGSFNVGAIGPYMGAINAATSTAGGVLSVIDRDTPLDAVDDKKGMKPMKLEGHLRVENIKHIYPSRPGVTVLNGVTLDFPAGKTTALVGGSGSGKSTIVGLIERFYNPIEGTVFLDGQDISKLNLRWLRQQIGLVAQEPTLFAGSILENISFGLVGSMYEHADEETQREMIISAAKSANAHEFISQLPEGYETKVGQRGSMLSGGQKQRIAIARAIVSDPKSESYPRLGMALSLPLTNNSQFYFSMRQLRRSTPSPKASSRPRSTTLAWVAPPSPSPTACPRSATLIILLS
jgi:ATP-binding cassette subfamily B (MDR/TAP) protein 1